jgi:hypothetical protein
MKTLKKAIVIVISALALNMNAQIKVVSGGSVGIGQTSPGSKLDILNSSGGNIIRATMGGSNPLLDVWQASSGGSGARTSLLFSNGAFEVYDANNSTTRLWISNNANGNMGVGNSNTSPSSKFDILVPATSSGTNALGVGMGSSNPTLTIWQTTGSPARTSAIYNNGGFEIFRSGSSAPALWVNQSNDNIGIGQRSSSGKLDILNSNNGYAFIAGLGGTDPKVSIWQTTSTARTSLIYENGAFEIYNAAGSTSEFYVNTSGKVGIGTNAPNASYKLTVNGSALASGGTWTNSDKRYKKNIQPIENAMEKLNKINGVSYEFKTEEFKNLNFTEGKSLGFIAQDLKEVLPEAVRIDKDGYHAVNYSEIIPVLVEALKEQAKVNNNLMKKVDVLEQVVNSCCKSGSIQQSKASNPNESINLSDKNSIVLDQNTPNPFADNTVIKYSIPSNFTKAQILFTTGDGRVIKIYDIREKGNGVLNVYANDLTSGMYTYSLVVDGKTIDTKKMIKN